MPCCPFKINQQMYSLSFIRLSGDPPSSGYAVLVEKVGHFRKTPLFFKLVKFQSLLFFFYMAIKHYVTLHHNLPVWLALFYCFFSCQCTSANLANSWFYFRRINLPTPPPFKRSYGNIQQSFKSFLDFYTLPPPPSPMYVQSTFWLAVNGVETAVLCIDPHNNVKMLYITKKTSLLGGGGGGGAPHHTLSLKILLCQNC